MRFALPLLFGARGSGLLLLSLTGSFALSAFRLLSLLLVLILLLGASRAARLTFGFLCGSPLIPLRLRALAVFLATFLPAPATTLCIRSVCGANQ